MHLLLESPPPHPTPARFVCARQLKSVRKQFNEYKSTKHTLLYITLCLGSFVIIVIFLLADDFVLRRRVAVLCKPQTTTKETFPLESQIANESHQWHVVAAKAVFRQLPSSLSLEPRERSHNRPSREQKENSPTLPHPFDVTSCGLQQL